MILDYSRHQSSSVSPSRSYGSNASQSSTSSASSYTNGNASSTVPMNGGYGSPPSQMTTGSQGLFNGRWFVLRFGSHFLAFNLDMFCYFFLVSIKDHQSISHFFVFFSFIGMSGIVPSPFAMSPFAALPNGQSYGSSIVSAAK